MKSSNKDGKAFISLPTAAQRAIWTHELRGQFSDGYWENSRGDWQFWCDLNVVAGVPEVVCGYGVSQRSYNVLSKELLVVVGERMCKKAKMAQVTDDADMLHYADYMPETMSDYMAAKTGKTFPSWSGNLTDLLPEQVAKYYSLTYTLKDLRVDLKVIKQAMKTAGQYDYQLMRWKELYGQQ